MILFPQILLANENLAQRKLTEALIKEFKIDNFVKQATKKYIPDYIIKHTGIVFGTYNTVTKGYIEFKWVF